MPRYDYRCEGCGTVTETVRGFDDRSLPFQCPSCPGTANVIFTPPNPHNFHIPPNFRAVLGAPTWSDIHDRSERELARDPSIERAAVVASRPGVGNTISQPTPDLKRQVRKARELHPSHSV